MKIASIVTGPDTYLDHLGVLAYIMKMPLFITEFNTYQSALKFYPQVESIFKPSSDLDAEFLSTHFDALFESGKFFALEMAPLVELLYKKKMRYVYCPHGNSDKGHSLTTFVQQDLSLVYGNHMEKLLEKTGAIHFIHKTIRTGNYRLPFYLKYQSFYDDLTQKHILNRLNPMKPIILYAPSWQDGENPTSFFTSTHRLIEEVQSEFNLIIKLHPFLEKFHPAETYLVLEKHQKNPSVLFIDQFPCIYPLLQSVDLYVGDYSSIGYDFLAFDKPLYFLTLSEGPVFDLHKTGFTIPSNEHIGNFIRKTLKENTFTNKLKRKDLYLDVFGKEISFEELKGEILKSLLEKKEGFFEKIPQQTNCKIS